MVLLDVLIMKLRDLHEVLFFLSLSDSGGHDVM